MKLLTNYPVRVLATGFVVLTLLSIPLFWLRCLCRISLSEIMPSHVRDVTIVPSGYVSAEIDKDPNLTHRSEVSATIRFGPFPFALGIFNYFMSRSPGPSNSNVYVAKSKEDWAYFDKTSGRIICRYTDTETMPDRSNLRRQVQYHIGPEGISEIPEEELGRFVEPIIDRSWVDWASRREEPGDLVLYDRVLRRFFRIHFDKPQVVKGPKLGDDGLHDPIRIGLLDKNALCLRLDWLAPKKYPSAQVSSPHLLPGMRVQPPGPVIQFAQYLNRPRRLFVLDRSGRIELLDRETLRFIGPAGQLPRPGTLFGAERSAAPDNMLSYCVKPLYLGARIDPNKPEDFNEPTREPLRYAGAFAASLSRDGTSLAVATFDDKGQTKKSRYSAGRRDSSGELAYFGSAWAPASTVGKYLIESLHAPILSAASCLTALAFEAGAGHRALFFLPDSFVAMNARDNRGRLDVRLIATLILISPSIILAAWLACRVAKDAAAVGLTKNLRTFWALATLAFGLTGYITYRLTRPGITLITCVNCGKSRRPDTETCHHCNSKWDLPELSPPMWRVLGMDPLTAP